LSKLKTKCTKFDVGWDSAPDPIRGTYSATPRRLIWIIVSLLLRYGGEGKGEEGGKEGKGKGERLFSSENRHWLLHVCHTGTICKRVK